MQITPTVLVALATLALGVALPTVAATAPPPFNPSKVQCPVPSVELCAMTPTDSACGKVHLEHCKQLLGQAWATNPARSQAEVRTMLRPGVEPDMPKNLRHDGRFYPYEPTKGLVRALKIPGPSVLHPLERAQPLATGKAAKPGHRQPSWQNNGSLVTSCDEWAYESIYDWGRFVDSVALCDGDAVCAMDIAAMKQAPGIVGRTLQRSDGVALAPQLKLAAGLAPKNVMYSVGPEWVYLNGAKDLAKTPELAEMEADLKKGRAYRSFACATQECKAAPESYASEWDWHLKMRKDLAKLSFEEREEFARRRAEFERLYAAWARAAGEEKRKIDEKLDGMTPQRGVPRLDPGERMPWEAVLDPIERVESVQRFERALAKSLAGQVLPQRGAVPRSPVLRAIPSPAPDWGLGLVAAAPLPPVKPPAGPIPRDPLGREPVDLECGNALKGGAHLKRDILSCKLASFMREEWRRKKRGQLSCLDPDNHLCDWSPELFRDRMLGLGEVYLNQQQQRRDFCMRVQPGGKLSPLPVGAVEGSLNQILADNAKALTALKDYQQAPGPHGMRLGTSSGDSGMWGDVGLFAAGYSYEFGWGLGPNETKDGLVCSLEASTSNKVGIDSHVFGRRIALVDAGLTSTANQDRSKKITLKTWIKLLGVELFPGVDNPDITQLFSAEPPPYSKQTPRASMTFMAGPVPITLAAWGQLSLGYRISSKGEYGACDPAAPKFGLTTTFAPETAADAVAQVGVGISGVASVGIRGAINLIRLGFPLTANFQVAMEKVGELVVPALKIDAGLAVTLATLAGRAALYIEFLLFEDEWEIFSWPGVGPHRIELMKLFDIKLTLTGMLGGGS